MSDNNNTYELTDCEPILNDDDFAAVELLAVGYMDYWNDFTKYYSIAKNNLKFMKNLKIFMFDGIEEFFIIDDTFYTNMLINLPDLSTNVTVTKYKYYLNNIYCHLDHFDIQLPNHLEELTISLNEYVFWDLFIQMNANINDNDISSSLKKIYFYVLMDKNPIINKVQIEHFKSTVKLPYMCEFICEIVSEDILKCMYL